MDAVNRYEWAEMKDRILLCLLALAFLFFGKEAFSQGWWNSAWQARREVAAYVLEERTPDGEVGWCRFYTMGMVKPDGSDIRVVAKGKPTPHKVLCVGPGDTAVVAFKLIPKWKRYHIYFGNPEAEPPEEKWEPKRGLLIETRKLVGGAVANWQQLRDTFKRSRPVQGAAYIDAIFLGHNLFGDSIYNTSKYTGYFQAHKDGNYTFVISSDDGSALLIDGKLVRQWPGWHGAVGDIRFKKAISLKKGLHKLEFYHVQGGGAQRAVVAWKPPWLQKLTIMGKAAFMNVQRATLTKLEIRKKNVAPDFLATNAGEAFLGGEGNRYIIKMKFTNTSAENVRKYYKSTWDFGDGTRSGDISPEHIYLGTGQYKVTLTMKGQEASFSTTNAIIVDRDWPNQIKRNIDDLRVYAFVVRKYDFSSMNAAALASAMELFAKVRKGLKDEKDKKMRALQQREMMSAYEKAAHFLLYTNLPADDELLLDKTDEYAEALLERKKYDEMNNLYLLTLKRLKKPVMKADAAIKIGNINVIYLENYKAAETFFNKVITEFKVEDFKTLRRAYIGLGDTFRIIDDYEKCLSFYRKAAAISVTDKRTYAKDEARKGGLSRMIEFYIREGDHETATEKLQTWLWEYPLDRLSGYASILIAKNHVLVKNYRLAVNELLAVARVTPKNNYADEALYLAAEYLMKMGQNEQAQKVLRQILSRYPETPLKEKVEVMIKKIEIIK